MTLVNVNLKIVHQTYFAVLSTFSLSLLKGPLSDHQQREVREQEVFDPRGKHEGCRRSRVHLEEVQLRRHEAHEQGKGF